MPRKLIEGIDYYYDEHGRWVFTEKYLKERGYCCKNGCKHCPYEFSVKKKNPSVFDVLPATKKSRSEEENS